MATNDQNLRPDEEQKLTQIFSAARSAQFETSPYLVTRVLAHHREQKRLTRQVWVWRAIASCAFVFAGLILGVQLMKLGPSSPAPVVAVAQAYVIHVDFSPSEVASVENVEVELPKGVRFYSKNRPEALAGINKLRLPLAKTLEGRNKLPFVVQSDEIGSKDLTVRLFDEKNRLVGEKKLSVNFKDSGQSVKL